MQALGDGVLDIREDADAGACQEARAEARVAWRGDGDRAVEDVADDLAPQLRARAAADEEDTRDGQVHLLERAIAVAQREGDALEQGAAEVAAL